MHHDGELILESIERVESFAALFDRHYPGLQRFIRARVGSDLADDLAAETFVRAFDGRSRFDARKPDARPWLFGIAMNLMRMHARGESRRLRAYAKTGEDPNEDFAAASDDRVAANVERRALIAAVAALNKGDREVLLLHAWAEMSHKEIAEALAIPEGTARSRLARAREQLSAELKIINDEEPVAEHPDEVKT